jgi:hypothetical protein
MSKQRFHRVRREFGIRISGFIRHSSFVIRIFRMIRVVLPFHLRNLARVDGEVELAVAAPVTIRAVVDALEKKFPALRGTLRDHDTLKRRPFIRFFACKEDVSLEPSETLLPAEIVNGTEPFLVVGAMAGG